jgi:ribosomal protein S12 methylthiotransferase accessory factor
MATPHNLGCAPACTGDGGGAVTWLSRLERDLDRPAAKAHRDGTHRIVGPRRTLERLRPLLPAMGITRIANVTGLDYLGIPVVMVARPNSRILSVTQGKGADLDHAKASGIMEAAESFHGERISLPLKLLAYSEIAQRHAVVDPAALPSVPDSLYHPNLPILWIEGFELASRRPIWLPYESIHVNFALPLPQGSGCFVSSTNGLASGNHILEAVSAGICEVVERDADALWLQADAATLRSRRVDLDSIDDEHCRAVLDKYRQARMTAAVWDTTSDIGIPSYRCHIHEADDNPNDPQGTFFGAGCHPSRAVALLRALTEAAQSRLTYISGSRDDIERRDYRRPGDETPADASRRNGGAAPSQRPFQATTSGDTDTLNADLRWELAQLQAAGLNQVIVVDLTMAEFGLPVVKAVIPGLEGVPDGAEYVPGARARAAAARPS